MSVCNICPYLSPQTPYLQPVPEGLQRRCFPFFKVLLLHTALCTAFHLLNEQLQLIRHRVLESYQHASEMVYLNIHVCLSLSSFIGIKPVNIKIHAQQASFSSFGLCFFLSQC